MEPWPLNADPSADGVELPIDVVEHPLVVVSVARGRAGTRYRRTAPARRCRLSVARGEIMKTLTPMAKDSGQDEVFRDISKYLNHSLNGYAHGASRDSHGDLPWRGSPFRSLGVLRQPA